MIEGCYDDPLAKLVMSSDVIIFNHVCLCRRLMTPHFVSTYYDQDGREINEKVRTSHLAPLLYHHAQCVSIFKSAHMLYDRTLIVHVPYKVN